MMRIGTLQCSRLVAALAATLLLSLVACSTSNAATKTASQAGTQVPVQTTAQAPSGAAATPTPAIVSQTATGLPAIYFTDSSGRQVEMDVEVASSEAQRETGLMNRTDMPEDQGMIFIWPAPVDNHVVAFWMQDTEIPLSIAFIDANGVVVSVDEMQAETTDLHYAAAPYQYAVEANAGWFASHDIAAGSQVDLSQVQQYVAGAQR